MTGGLQKTKEITDAFAECHAALMSATLEDSRGILGGIIGVSGEVCDSLYLLLPNSNHISDTRTS